MTPCPRCGGPQILLLTSWACKAECDLRVHVDKPLTGLSMDTIFHWIKFMGYPHQFPSIVASGVPSHCVPTVKPLSVCLLEGNDPTKLRQLDRIVKPVPGTDYTWQILPHKEDFGGMEQVLYWVDLSVDDPYSLLSRHGGRMTVTYEARGRLPT